MFRWRYSELADYVEAERLQRIADNNQNFIQHHNMTPVFTEHQAIHGRDTTIYNYPHYDPSYSGQPPSSIIGSPLLHQQMTQHTTGSTAWPSPSNIYSNDPPYSFSRYTSTPGLGLSDAHLVDTPPITYAQPFNYDTHYQMQSPGGPYFGHVVNDELESDMHPGDSPPITPTQPVHYDTYRPFRLPGEAYFGPVVSDGSEADTYLADSTPTTHIIHSATSTTWQSPSNIYYDPPYSFSHCTSAPGLGLSDAHLADTPPIADFNYDIHYQIQSPGGTYFGPVVSDGSEADTHLADSTPTTHIIHSTTSTTSPSNIYYDPPYSFFHCTSAPGLGLSDAHLADTSPITHFNYDIRYQIQSPGGPYFGHVVNDGSGTDTHLANSTPIIHHQIQLAEVGPTVNEESDSNASRCPYTCMWRNCGQIAAEGVVGHMTTFHLIRGETHYVCQWRGCQRSEPYRRDTLCRHISEVHLRRRRRTS